MRITELVKTYKLLNDPNAPDWNVKFVGAAVLALGIVAAGGFAFWQMTKDDAAIPPVTAAQAEAPPACTAEQVAAATPAYLAAHPGATEIPRGARLANGCVVV